MTEIKRTPVTQAREMASGGRALLVCAYEDQEVCRRNRLQGSMLRQEFESRLEALPKEKEIIFYCA